jgi:hypothetical protein
MNNKLNIQLTLDEANIIIESLAAQPYGRVYELVGKIQAQAREQLSAQVQSTAAAEAKQESKNGATAN